MKVLITDDSRFTRSVLRKMMVAMEFDVVEAENGMEAVSLLEEEVFDLCLVDLNMPEMTGIEVLRAMAAHDQWSQIPAIMITDEPDQDRIDQAKAAGAVEILPKPFQAPVLKTILQRIGLDV